ncbi:MAG: hypothetical protein ACXVB0_08725 [Mucilaginibacter sp.]
MKTLILSAALVVITLTVKAQDDGVVRTYQVDHPVKTKTPVPPTLFDSIKLQTDNGIAYYQKAFKVDSDIKVSAIYLRALQFMAGKNFQQNYGYEEEGKLIYTTTQDLNKNMVYSDTNDEPEPYTVQFAVTIDIKNARYRCTFSNITFYLSAIDGNRRVTLNDIYQKAINGDSKRVKRDAKGIIDSFEKYILTLTRDLYAEIEHKAMIYNSKF